MCVGSFFLPDFKDRFLKTFCEKKGCTPAYMFMYKLTNLRNNS